MADAAKYAAPTTLVSGESASKKAKYHRLSGVQYCTDLVKACDATTVPLAARTALGVLQTPEQQRSVDVQSALAYAVDGGVKTPAHKSTTDQYNELVRGWGTSVVGAYYDNVQALQTAADNVKDAMFAAHAHVAIAFACESTAEKLAAVDTYAPGMSVWCGCAQLCSAPSDVEVRC
jgi:hypothetical protein